MSTIKKGTNKAKNYTKKKRSIIYNNSKILVNFYKQSKDLDSTLFGISINKNSIMSKFLEHVYMQFNNKQQIINGITIEKSRSQIDNKNIINSKITSIVNKYLIQSIYIDKSIINFIISNVHNCKIVTYENIIKGKSYVFDFIIYNDEIAIKKLDIIVEKMLLLLQVLIAISNNETRNGQHITFFLTPFLKELNNNKDILGAKNVNTGFTYPYLENGVTFIYRKEEFFKVFIHESIHYYGIDKALHQDLNNTSNYSNFINLFNISNKHYKKLGIQESLTEFWTFVMLLCVISYKKNIKFANYIYEFERLYKTELIHIIFQLVKILNYNNLTYVQLLSNSTTNTHTNTHTNTYTNKYKETSHIFSYYIVKAIMVYNHEDLFKSNIFDLDFSTKINICLKQDNVSINNFLINLRKYALNTQFIALISKVGILFNKIQSNIYMKSIYRQKFILNNLRMMSNELIII